MAEEPLVAGGLGEPVFLTETGVEMRTSHAPEYAPLGSLTFYDHGEPTDFEQLMLELVNRARANPGAEADRLGIDLNEDLHPGEIADTPKQPVGSHRFLIDAARGHSQWMLDNDVFSHTGAGGSSPSQRAQAAGYPSGAGENIAWVGTTGEVDPEAFTRDHHDGLFISPGHRLNICNGSYREIGLGILLGAYLHDGTQFNSLMTTQKFGSSPSTPWPFVVGVAFYDFNGNGVYDPGEGIGGIEVQVAGGSYYTATASAGGYTLPRPSAGGERVVTFSGPGLEESFLLNMAAGQNHKVDLKLDYEPPAFSGPAAPLVGQVNAYAISPVPGATAFEVGAFTLAPTAFDGAEDLSRVIDGTSGAYSAISTTVKYEGSGAYRFAHPEFADQTLEYEAEFFAGEGASLAFRSRLGWATGMQVARVEVSVDGGKSWVSVFSQPGTGGGGEGSFQARSASLAAFAGEVVRIRFRYAVGGGHFPQTSDGVGWYVDAVEFHGIETLTLEDEATVDPGAEYVFTPSSEGASMLVAQPRNFDRLWPAGPPLLVEAMAAPGGYAAWAQMWESSGGLAAGALAGAPTADFSKDGLPNIAAYALALNPLVSSVGEAPRWREVDGASVFEYTVDTTAEGVAVVPELSTDLADWHPVGAAPLGFASADALVSSEDGIERRRVTFTNGFPSSVYARVRISVP
ncbi:MAG: hypothetical protein JJT96_02980 [Opitutales bacterium]|nr:hypothetical protein [Opitutales bacterium]